MSDKTRKFKMKLSGFDQMWQELKRLEERERILVNTLFRMCTACETGDKSSAVIALNEALDNLRLLPGKSKGYKMIEQMGLDFYEEFKKEMEND